jgi:hypothetical protein
LLVKERCQKAFGRAGDEGCQKARMVIVAKGQNVGVGVYLQRELAFCLSPKNYLCSNEDGARAISWHFASLLACLFRKEANKIVPVSVFHVQVKQASEVK